MSGAATDQAMPVRIACVLYPGFTALDLVGPYEVISRWPEAQVHFLARPLVPFAATAT